MGLDMYGYACPKDKLISQDLSFHLDSSNDPNDKLYLYLRQNRIAQWRKVHRVHEWFAQLYKDKTGRSDEFNCTYLRLDEDDLNKLHLDIVTNALSEIGYWDAEDQEETFKFIDSAKSALKEGLAVIYSASY